MKILKHSLLILVLATTGMAHLDAMKRAKPNFDSDDTAQQVMKKTRFTDQAIHPDLIFTPDDPGYYAIIEHELNMLENYRATINSTATTALSPFSPYYIPHITKIELTTDACAQSKAPMLYALLSSKISLISKRMGLDISKLKICIDLDEANGPVFNAASIFSYYEVSFNAGLLKLAAWHEGSTYFHLREGILDCTIAHELAHIFHQHCQPGVMVEFEADQTAARNMRSPHNMIQTNFMLPLAQSLLSILSSSTLFLSPSEKFSIICILSSALIKKYPDLGNLGDCSRTEFFHNIKQAAEIINNTSYPVKYNFFAVINDGKKLEDCDQKNICSLIYEQLIARCKQVDRLLEDSLTNSGTTTHPSSRKRKSHILNFIQNNNNGRML